MGCHLARQVNPILCDPNIQVLANLFGGRPWVNGCQGMRPATPATKNQAKKAEPKDTKPAEKKPETEKIAEAKKTECGEPSKPATPTEHTTDQTSANPNGLPGILADLTPLLGPLQAEQLAQFLRNISAPQQNHLPVGLGVEGSLSQEDGLLLGGNAELVVEGVVPDLLHVVPVGDDSVLDGVLQGEDTPLGLGLVTDVGILLSHADHDTLVTGTSNDGGEDGPGGVVSGEAGLAHAGAIVTDKSGNVLVTHLGCFEPLCSRLLEHTTS